MTRTVRPEAQKWSEVLTQAYGSPGCLHAREKSERVGGKTSFLYASSCQRFLACPLNGAGEVSGSGGHKISLFNEQQGFYHGQNQGRGERWNVAIKVNV